MTDERDFVGSPDHADPDRELLEALLDAEGLAPARTAAIARRGALSAPLSPAQRRFWFLQELDPQSTAYTISGAVLLRGSLDAAALEEALSAVVARHEALRTLFVPGEADGEPRQVIQTAAPMRLERLCAETEMQVFPDAGDVASPAAGPGDRAADGAPTTGSEVERGARRVHAGGAAARAAGRGAAELASRGWDLARGPLVRAALLEVGPLEHALVVAMHHIIADGWSIGLLLAEIGEIYRARVAGEAPALPGPAIQQADHAAWQIERIASGALETQIAFWRAELTNLPAPIALPADHAGPTAAPRRGATVRFAIDGARARALVAAARRAGATPFHAHLACFEALLGRLCGREAFLLGTPVANRDAEETAGLVALLVNTVPVRADLSGDPTLSELVIRARHAARGAIANAEVPFEVIVEMAGARGSDSPLFQTMFAYQDTRGTALALPGLEVESIDVEDGTAKFELTLFVEEREDRFACALEYDAGRFERSTIERLAARYARLVDALAGGSSARLSEIDLTTDVRERGAIPSLQGVVVERAPGATIHGLFEAAAARKPDAVAVEAGEERATYGDLERRAHGIALRLRALGARSESRIGLMVERSVDLVASLLGILESGACYVPLDASNPDERLALMVHDAGVEIVVASRRHAARAGELGVKVIDPDGAQAAGSTREHGVVPGAHSDGDAPGTRVANASGPLRHADQTDTTEDAVGVRASGDALAYVLFTSGSTGAPKGVMVTHRGVVNYLLWAAGAYRAADEGGAPVATPLGFDLTVTSLLAPLIAGGRIVLAGEREGLEGYEALEALARERDGFALVKLTPAHIELLAETLRPEQAARFARCLVVGGEALHGKSLAFWRAHAPGTRIVNEYGPTETVVGCCVHEVGANASLDGAVPIGRPIANTRLYVLDSRGRPTPHGEPGDLFIGGAGLARGYAGRPDLTAERFLPDPFAAEAGSRMYATGDRVRLRADGGLDYLGRSDAQVKVRGHRVEPGEVEAILRRHPEVRDAAVVAIPEARGGARLAAFYVAPSGLTGADLRAHARRSLPASMVPEQLTRVDALPLTPNGKVDRAALAAVVSVGAECDEAARVPAQGPIEEIIAGIWGEVLAIGAIGATQNVFDLGGHSIAATRVRTRIRRALGVELPLRALFDEPTVRGLAARVASMLRAPAPPIGRAEDRERRRLSYAQRRLWFLDRLEPDSAAYNIANAIRIDGGLDVGALSASLSEIVARHEALRSRFEEDADGPVQIIDDPEPVPIATEDLTAIPAERREEEAARRAGALAREPFDLARGPLLRARLMRLGPSEHVLVLVVHHIASDGWSMGILVDELTAGYAARCRGERPALPELPVQYADWAAWQRAWLEGGEMERQLAHWRTELADLPRLDLPADKPRPARPLYTGASFDVRIEPQRLARLKHMAREEGATLHMALLAAFAAVLGRWSGQRDFGIGTPVANRTREEAEGLIGFFVNSLVVRARLEGARLPFRDLLGRIREAALGAYANQDVPFERVVEAVQPERDLTRTPLFQVMLILQNAPAGDLGLAGVTLRPFDAPTQTSTFDLTLSLAPAGEALEGFIEYSTELFEEQSIRRLWDHVARLLAIVTDEPGTCVHAARLLAPEERTRAVEAWSGRGDLIASARTIHDRFAEQAAAAPERVAARLGDRSITYRELLDRSRRLAARLALSGVGLEGRVGLCVDRSPEMLVGMMAVLDAGGAFVPLDPDHPRDRIRLALEASGARVVLATRASAPLVAREGCEVIGLEDPSSYAAAPLTPRVRPSGQNIAYIIFTSGTTGLPKGVMVTHGAIGAAYEAWERLYGLGDLRVHLQMAGIAFDVCTGDVVRALCSGGTLVFCERERLLDPVGLLDLARREPIEFAEFVPAVLRSLAARARESGVRLDTMRTAVVGSDVWTGAEIAEFRRLFAPGARLANSYGVTEATIDSTCWFVGDGGGTAGSPPIGRPLAHTTVYVLDEALEPVPAGVTGELYIGGPAVARGYVGMPDLTAERFVPDPFGDAGARLYRTGDRARYLADGRIAFAGRADDQIKIRGLRIEPAEVEAALRALDGVAACVVAARRGAGSGPRLAAYVVARASGGFDAERARQQLRARLPEAMIPSAFVLLEALPLTPNGKVDRRRLPEPEWEEPAAYEPPRTRAEEAVAAAFAEVLGRNRVGAGDDFFALGGHSLLATQVVSRLRAALGIEVPLRALFETPIVRDLAAGIGSLDESAAPPPIVPASTEARRLASHAQRRLWFLDRLEPMSAAYNLPSSVRLEGELDTDALALALTEVARRHEALRTRFVEGADGPEQVIDPPAQVPLDIQDLSGFSEDARRRAAECETRAEARAPFDLARGPLLRAKLLRLGEREHLLLLTLHHIAADGWSLGVLVRELGAIYGAYAAGSASALPEPAVQYADWSAWQRSWLEGGENDRQLAFWRRELQGAETLALPSDRPRPARPTYAGGSLTLTFGAPLRADLERLARACGATLHMVLLAAYAATLGRWSGQTQFAVGTPIANRRAAEVESLIGFFVNTLPMRVRLEGRGLTFRDLLGRVREAALGAYAHQDIPFERIVEDLQPDRALGHNPIVQTLFALQNAPVGEIALPGLALRYEEPDTGVTRFDLELFLGETTEGLEGTINFSAELFDRATVERLVENLTALLERAVANPDAPLTELAAPSPRQLRRALIEWNGSREIYGERPLVHALVERRAAETPDAPAARFGAERLSYAELNGRANRLARHLIREGIGQGRLVGICLDRSLDVLVCLLAVLKTGAAYVPIDPEYPGERIALILEDSGARVVLTRSALVAKVPLAGAHAVDLDAEMDRIGRESPDDLGLEISPDALAYSVYTSGSTGRPKGVAMSHRAISNMLAWQRRDSGAAGAPRTLQFASLSFDVSFQEIFSTLTAGGEVVLVAEEERRDAVRLLRLLDAQEVERLFVPFVALDQLAEAASAEGTFPRSLREVDTAGEQLRITPAIAAFFARLPGCRLVNHYGPSEAHLVTTFELRGDSSRWQQLPPIGRPIANAAVYLLDDDGRPVPIGAPGEVYVGGAGLARGYHDRPDLTAERFVPDPFGGEPGGRLYRTGDLARHHGDGTLEFLGRRDLQVKIRGYRVEPGEIEAALTAHPAVRQAAVVAREHGGSRRLAAYVVLEAREEIPSEGAGRASLAEDDAPSVLREHLARRLPAFMVPSSIVVLEALPLTPNGKVNRAALPEPDWAHHRAAYAAPRTPGEEIVCGIFAEVLGIERAGAGDDFFELGGHSLLATQVISRVRRALGVELPLRSLFETPTPAGVAAAAAAARATAAPRPPDIVRAAAPERRLLSYAQRRIWFLDRLDPGAAVYNLPVAVTLEGNLQVAALGRALGEIVRRHEILRTRYVEGPEGPEQIVDAPVAFDLAFDDVAGAADPEVAARRMLETDARGPFDLARGPVLRARLIRLGPRLHRLGLVVHHIAADGWSLGVLVRELGSFYEAHAEGRESPPAERGVQYADWAAWQRGWLEGGEMDRQLAWWRLELEGAPTSLELPADRARPLTATGRGTTLEMRLPRSLRETLARAARAEGATLHMALLAGYAWTLMRRSGRYEVVVGTPVANRRAAEAEDLVGFFVNTLAVRVRGDEGLGYRQLLSRVREASLRAYDNQDVPFERVVEELQPERALNRSPLFQTAFALQNARIPRLELSGLRVAPFAIDTETAKFDLMLTIEETVEGLEGVFEYSTDLFDRATIEEIAADLRSVLEAGAAEPAVPLCDLMAPARDEALRILAGADVGQGGERAAVRAPEAARGTPGDAAALPSSPIRGAGGAVLLHALVEAQVDRAPEAPAIAQGDEEVTYREVERRANRLAHHLRDLGAGPEARVALLLPRAPDAIVALLAVLKAGAAYVPLEPAHPDDRLLELVDECGAVIVVTDADGAARVHATPATVVAIDRDAARIAKRPRRRPAALAKPENLAYVIFTSGSTGKAKGVGVEHRQISAYVAAVVERLGIGPGWRFGLVSTLAADLGHTSIFPALATGGCLDLLPAGLALDAPGAEAYFSAHPIDALKIVPTHLEALIGGPRPARVLPRRLLVLGGEATSGAQLAAIGSVGGPRKSPTLDAIGAIEASDALVALGVSGEQRRIAIHYGPTETTVGALAGLVDAGDAARASAPLGRPLAGARVHVLDRRGHAVPPGVPGEIVIAGAGVARGYVGRPDLTAERFVPDPYAPTPGGRAYRTGDRGRVLRDGRMEFLGRIDEQVKVRGYRVEPGEVEAAIARHPGVREAAVAARRDPAGGSRLVACVVADPRVAPAIGGLPRRKLPNGIAVAELNRHETEYIFREIFELGAYVRHGIGLAQGDTVLDVGANIGLFALFASLARPSVRLLAFEPNPHLLPILRANAAVYAPRATICDFGLGDREGSAPFTFFPGFSLFSGLYADAATERCVVRTFLENQERAGITGAAELARESEALLEERFAGRPGDVPLRRLSDVLAEQGIERVGLLKINVEKAELDVLRGIDDRDWGRIDQAVVEIDTASNLGPIVAMFEAHGFEVLVDQDPLLERTELRYLYAARRGSGRTLSPGAGPSVAALEPLEPLLTVEALRAHAARLLPDYMVPSAWIFLESLPLTPNGKIDRSRLPEPRAESAAYQAPQGSLERAIAGIWAELLGLGRVGAHDNFFDLGGHSLLLARVHARLREEQGADLSIVEMFRFPTVASLAARLARPERRDEAPLRDRARGERRRDAARARVRGAEAGGGE